MTPVSAVVLEGHHVQLAPLAPDHLDALVAAASGPRETFALTFVPHGPDEVRAWRVERGPRGLTQCSPDVIGGPTHRHGDLALGVCREP